MILEILPVWISHELFSIVLTYIEFGPIYFFQLDRGGMLSRIFIVDIAYSMRREVGLTILITLDFVLVSVEAYCILDEQ